MVTLAILAKQKALSVPALKEQMPYTILIRHDPRANEKLFKAGELNDSVAIYELMEFGWPEKDPDSSQTFVGECEVSRRSVPYVEGGPAPADDYNDIWDVVIPGGVMNNVRVSQVAILLPNENLPTEVQTLLALRDPELILGESVYSITAIGQDRQKYIARITMVQYGLIKSGGRSG